MALGRDTGGGPVWHLFGAERGAEVKRQELGQGPGVAWIGMENQVGRQTKDISQAIGKHQEGQ